MDNADTNINKGNDMTMEVETLTWRTEGLKVELLAPLKGNGHAIKLVSTKSNR